MCIRRILYLINFIHILLHLVVFQKWTNVWGVDKLRPYERNTYKRVAAGSFFKLIAVSFKCCLCKFKKTPTTPDKTRSALNMPLCILKSICIYIFTRFSLCHSIYMCFSLCLHSTSGHLLWPRLSWCFMVQEEKKRARSAVLKWCLSGPFRNAETALKSRKHICTGFKISSIANKGKTQCAQQRNETSPSETKPEQGRSVLKSTTLASTRAKTSLWKFGKQSGVTAFPASI